MAGLDRIVRQGDIWWADLRDARGSEPGYRRPMLVVQQTVVNISDINTILCVPLTTNQRLANAPGNLLLEARYTRLRKPSVANVSQLYALDKRYFREYVSTIPEKQLEEVIEGILFLLGR